jgi:hypothetical protein
MKRLFGTLTALAFVGVLAWTGGYLYWHIRLVGAIRTLEMRSGPQGSDADAVDIIRDAGCKSVPYLIGAMQPAKNPYFLVLASSLLAEQLELRRERDKDIWNHLQEWRITPETSVDGRRTNCDALHAWWRDKGAAQHSGVAWWKRDCGGI